MMCYAVLLCFHERARVERMPLWLRCVHLCVRCVVFRVRRAEWYTARNHARSTLRTNASGDRDNAELPLAKVHWSLGGRPTTDDRPDAIELVKKIIPMESVEAKRNACWNEKPTGMLLRVYAVFSTVLIASRRAKVLAHGPKCKWIFVQPKRQPR